MGTMEQLGQNARARIKSRREKEMEEEYKNGVFVEDQEELSKISWKELRKVSNDN